MPTTPMRYLVILLVAVVFSSFGCGESASVLPTTGNASDETVVEETAEAADIRVRTIEPELGKARDELKSRYDGFLDREPVGFGPEVWDALGEDLRDRIVDFSSLRSSVQRGDWRKTAEATLPLWITVIFIIVLAFIDRPAMRVARRWQVRVHIGSNQFITEVTRAAIFVAGRCFSVSLLVLLSYFPVQAVFDQAPWSKLATILLWLVLAYRALAAIVIASLGIGVVLVSDENAARLKSFAIWALRLTFAFLALIQMMRVLEWHADVQAFARVAFRATVALIPAYLFVARDAIADLIPQAESSPVYKRFRHFLISKFHPILTVTIVLLGLRAVGFVHASSFILLRGYLLALLTFVALLTAVRTHEWLTRRRETGDSREQRDLFRSLTYLLRIAGTLLVLWAGLRTLELWSPLVIVLKIPIVSIGGNALSVFKVLTALFVMGAAVLFGRLLRAVLLTKVYPALKVDVGVGYAVNTLINYALIVIGFFIALTALGVNLSALTVVLASLGVGIGFGLQTLTENLISGFILLFGRSVKKGDIITAGDLYGRVEEVGARSVLVKTPDNYDLLIPSKEIVGSRIVNWSYHDSLVRLHVPVGVTYSANPREVKEILISAAKEHDFVLSDPSPEVWLTEFGDSSVNFSLLVYFNCRETTQERLIGQLNFIIWDRLHENDIEIPFPQRDLHIRSGGFAEPVADAILEKLRTPEHHDVAAGGDPEAPNEKEENEEE